MPDSEISRLDRWKLARDVIQHEDNLVNQRLVWFLTLQGFLFTGLALSASALSKVDTLSVYSSYYYLFVHTLMIFLSLTGSITPLLVIPGAHDAYQHGRTITRWWNTFGSKSNDEWNKLLQCDQFPPIKGIPAARSSWLSTLQNFLITGYTNLIQWTRNRSKELINLVKKKLDRDPPESPTQDSATFGKGSLGDLKNEISSPGEQFRLGPYYLPHLLMGVWIFILIFILSSYTVWF